MSALAGSQGPVNGDLAHPPSKVNEFLEYEKILKIRDQVFTGSHPRLTVPAHVVRKVSSPAANSQPQLSIPSVSISSPSSVKLPGLQLSNVAESPPLVVSLPDGPQTVSRSYPAGYPASGIDPIFLTKSDDLVRAEMQLSRRRIERALREQLDRRRIESRHKTSPQEAKPDFDVSDVVAKAMEVAKPVTFEDASGNNDNASASETFDENSFYSSKAPDSTPRDGIDIQQSPIPKHQVQHMDVDDLDADGPPERRSDEARQVDLTDSPYKLNPRPDLNAQRIHLQPPLPRPNGVQSYHESAAATLDDNDEDEPEYSPPEPMQHTPDRNNNTFIPRDQVQERGTRLYGGYSDHHHNGARYDSPPEPDMRVVRNHITSPIAPQPSRVSPLAVAKPPSISQNRRQQQDQAPQRRAARPEMMRASPELSSLAVQPRKRRKLEGRKLRRRAVSPEPVVKGEPVSPPPFHEVKPLGNAKPRQSVQRPIYIDDDLPRDVRYAPALGAQAELAPRRVVYEMEPPLPATEPRLQTRPGLRDAMRDEQHLRRVSSLQDVRTEPPHERAQPFVQTPTRFSRAPSYALVEESTRPEHFRLYPEKVQLYDRPVARDTRLVHSPVYLQGEAQSRYQHQSMAPPARRIVVDQDGNRFYETFQPTRAAAASMTTRELGQDEYNATASTWNGTVRATSIFEDPYHERRYVHDMGPPQISYRHVPETPRSIVAEPRPVYREEMEPGHIQRSASVQVVDYPTKRPIYVDDRAGPREVVRIPSVRPAMAQHEDPRETVQCVQNVYPDGREVSVFVDDRPQVRRQYVQMDEPHQEIRQTVRGSGYYEVDNGSRIAVGMPLDGRHSVVHRY